MVEWTILAEKAWFEPFRIALGKPDAVAKTGLRHRPGRRLQHFRRCIQPEKLGVWIKLRHENQVSRRAAADLDQPLAGPKGQFPDQPVAPEKIIFPSKIIDMTLAAIDAIHQPGVSLGHGQDRGRR